MRVHSCEADFRVVCGIGNCPASFRRNCAYKKHVYRTHRNTAGVVPPTAAENASFPAAPSLPADSSSSEGTDDVASEGPSEVQPMSAAIKKQLLLF